MRLFEQYNYPDFVISAASSAITIAKKDDRHIVSFYLSSKFCVINFSELSEEIKCQLLVKATTYVFVSVYVILCLDVFLYIAALQNN